MKSKTILVLVIALFIMLFFIAGCGTSPLYSNSTAKNSGSESSNSGQQTQATTVQTIGDVIMSAENWDADPEVDGLEFDLSPRDKDDVQVESEGTISIKLWKTIGYDDKCLKRDEDLLEQWNNIKVTKGDYSIFGATIRAEYKNYQVTDDKSATGCAEVTFTTPDGKSFVSFDDLVFINGI